MKAAFQRGFGLFVAVLQEIFDESAYLRFLARERLAPSREAYRLFSQECAAARKCRLRCC